MMKVYYNGYVLMESKEIEGFVNAFLELSPGSKAGESPIIFIAPDMFRAREIVDALEVLYRLQSKIEPVLHRADETRRLINGLP